MRRKLDTLVSFLVVGVFVWLSLLASTAQSFAVHPHSLAVAENSRSNTCHSLFAAPTTSSSVTTAELGSTTEHHENYDVVKVDLDDGRDYPIYIGTGYSDDEGK